MFFAPGRHTHASEYETPPESPIPIPFPRKRKRSSYGRKRSRGGKRSKPRATQGSGGSHLDDRPPAVEASASNREFICCDRCAGWFHFECVGLQGLDHEDDTPWECPLCVGDPTRGVVTGFNEGEGCSMPGCNVPKSEEFFVNKLVGRRYDPDTGVVKYLVSYEGYSLADSTWEPPEHLANATIREFLDQWGAENPGVDLGSLDPHENIFLREAVGMVSVA
ncbi:hypothetical protein BJ322DRAFT_730978 [Thelephora terrestris]|uniref:Chromo domain-containing protein n=1 Tax=Thelephora terrestris TaxID=56493 RepID=A0A9P6H179_9AGAM|nr:hypothetical protein BJ322DRAFT_730978 [Thelephora terrestris]